MKIIGFSGKIMSGKSTVAKYLKENIPNSIDIAFADALKSLVSMFFGEGDEQTLDLNQQETKQKMHSCGKTYRQLLQEIGTHKMREVWPDIWIHNWRKRVLFYEHTQADVVILVSDVRFPNEVKAIQDLGGIVIRLTRNPVDSKDESETALDNQLDSFDYIIDNSTQSVEETNKLCLKITTSYIEGK